MSRYCGKCGAPLQDGFGFCGSCGAGTQQQAIPSQQQAFQPVAQQATSPSPEPKFQPVSHPVPSAATPQPAFQPVSQTVTPGATPTPAAAAKTSSPWLKVVIVVVIVIFAAGALAVGGVVYVAHKVSQKAHEYSREVLGETSPTTAATPADKSADATTPADKSSAVAGDACRLLSKEDVSRAIGVAIVETHTVDAGCEYLAKGTTADMAAKHAAAMMGAKGADKKTQGMFEQFAGGVFNNMPKEAGNDTETANGNVVVLTFGIDTNAAEEQMRLNSKVLGGSAIGGIEAIDGIGDEAFSKADSMIMARKGDKLIRIMYMTCPCGTDAIKPLAKQLVANL